MTEFEKGYIVGLIVGEGCFSGDGRIPEFCMKLHADDPKPLLFMQEKLGGKVYGIYERNGRRFWDYVLRGHQLRANTRFFFDYLPESKKRQQFLAWAERWRLEFWQEDAIPKVKQT